MWVDTLPKALADCVAYAIGHRDCSTFVSFARVDSCRDFAQKWLGVLGVAGCLTQSACGDHGFLPSSIDPGADFAVADVVFDESYFYCKVEPVLFAQSCGSGDPSKGDPMGGCHFSATAYRLTDYSPRVGDSCNGGLTPSSSSPESAQHNYQTSQARMKRDPDLAPLLQRPTLNQAHPRKIFDLGSPDADAIRQWATRFSNQ
jgi:hypothetical protein